MSRKGAFMWAPHLCGPRDPEAEYTDLELARAALRCEECFAVLAKRYDRILSYWSSRYFALGVNSDDFFQVALIAMHQAFGAYRGQIPLPNWVSVVVRRKTMDFLGSMTREKHEVLNSSLRVRFRAEEAGQGGYSLDFADPISVSQTAEGRERLRALVSLLPRLSELERRAIRGYVEGLTYSQMGDSKSIDNALQRGRRRLVQGLASQGFAA